MRMCNEGKRKSGDIANDTINGAQLIAHTMIWRPRFVTCSLHVFTLNHLRGDTLRGRRSEREKWQIH